VDDVKKAGFPLEVIARGRFTTKGWEARSQVLFYDKEESKSRYVDLVAHRAIDKHFQRFVRLNYTIVAECKKSDKPWIFYTPPTSFLTKERDLATTAYLRTISKPPLEPKRAKFLYHNHCVSEQRLDRVAVASYIAFSGEGYDQIFAATNQALETLQH
jgi:hypothetical protein